MTASETMGDESLTPELAAGIETLLDTAGLHANRQLVRRIVTSGLLLGTDGTERLNLKITAAALDEMREAFQLFAPFTATPKVSVFGSARTRTNDPLYMRAHAVAKSLADDGWMVVTGAGPGIMQAAADDRFRGNIDQAGGEGTAAFVAQAIRVYCGQ